jgi:hypothetical protein
VLRLVAGVPARVGLIARCRSSSDPSQRSRKMYGFGVLRHDAITGLRF